MLVLTSPYQARIEIHSSNHVSSGLEKLHDVGLLFCDNFRKPLTHCKDLVTHNTGNEKSNTKIIKGNNLCKSPINMVGWNKHLIWKSIKKLWAIELLKKPSIKSKKDSPKGTVAVAKEPSESKSQGYHSAIVKKSVK